MSLDGRFAVVVGATGGLGREIARVLLERGAYVYAAGRNPEALTEVEGCLRAVSTSFRLERLDVTDEASVCSFFGSLERVDIMVNSVGIGGFAPLLATETGRLRDILEVNVVAAFVLMREAARKMLTAGGGLIVNIVSDAALKGIPQMAPYVASKHALLGLGRSVAQELRQCGIRITSYCPGPLNTKMFGVGNPHALNPAHVAETVAHLAELPAEVEVREVLVEPLRIGIP